MDQDKLKKLLAKAFKKHGAYLVETISELPADRYQGIEAAFERAFLDVLGIQSNSRLKCEAIGSENFFGDRAYGLVDLTIKNEDGATQAFEFKAVRMPRKKADCCFDVSQLASDYLRLQKAKKIQSGWIIAFVYGPLVDDARSSRDLYRSFQNQMFVETSLSIAAGHLSHHRSGKNFGRIHLSACGRMGWRHPQQHATFRKGHVAALAKLDKGAIGAICFDARLGK